MPVGSLDCVGKAAESVGIWLRRGWDLNKSKNYPFLALQTFQDSPYSLAYFWTSLLQIPAAPSARFFCHSTRTKRQRSRKFDRYRVEAGARSSLNGSQWLLELLTRQLKILL